MSSVLALRDRYPVTEGHTLIIPKRHIATWFDATPAERMELWSAIDLVCEDLQSRYSPDGFNFGINSGDSAGQTVPHLHLHVIPRYKGDMDDPRGGVRHVIPEMGNYKKPGFGEPFTGRIAEIKSPEYQSDLVAPFTSGPDAPLLPALKRDISKSSRLDIAVAFVFRSGLKGLRSHLNELLERDNGRLRLITGDYLDATDPDALQDLLDLKSWHPDKCELYIYSVTKSRSFHPKSYLMFDAEGENLAYVGSSNISRAALVDGVEWNYRISSRVDEHGWKKVTDEFDALLADPNVQPLNRKWLKDYRQRRESLTTPVAAEPAPEPDEPLIAATPNEIQSEALAALGETRADGNRAGLVVMATGIGKTWLAAFDVASDRAKFARVLFVAHREEILQQSLSTFRRINPKASMGLYNGTEKRDDADILFASIQTLSRENHLRLFAEDDFDYLIVDEFHHAAANTYRRLIDYFKPKFMLGLTATPERTDGGDLLALCDENLVYRCDVPRGIELGLLSAYNYYGVPDNVDYKNIPWRSRKFDEKALTTAVETDARAQNIYEQWQTRGKQRTMAFCVSRSHANYMRNWFTNKGVKCASVHSGQDSDPRSLSLEQLEAGELQVVFAIDMFNEGVDIPALDTVMMLRPTESSIIWLQQFGRGLRKQGDKVLTVIDYIGNHRSFLLKLRALLNIQHGGDGALAEAIRGIKDGTLSFPVGCEVTYELEVIDILQALLRKSATEENALVQYYKDFRDQHGQRPTASEAFHDGYLPSTAKSRYGSWLGLVDAMGDLEENEKEVLKDHAVFLQGLETTGMSRSYKMVLLRAMLNLDALPGQGAKIEALTEAVMHLALRAKRVGEDFGGGLNSNAALQRSLKSNPIAAWTGTKALGGSVVFAFEEDVFQYIPSVSVEHREPFQILTRELVEWRLAAYLDKQPVVADIDGFNVKVSHSGGRPMLFLPDRKSTTNIPSDWVQVDVEGRKLFFNFKKVAVNVVSDEEDGANILPTIIRGWFGPDAGLPGTNFQVRLEQHNGAWKAVPDLKSQDQELSIHKRYAREQIPRFFGEEFNPGKWNAGHITAPTEDPKHIILLVTLEKADMMDEHQYADRFISNTEFQWQSQNSTTQHSKRGQQLKEHQSLGLQVHLFIRKTKKIGSKAAPFTYFGEMDFVDWDGEKPITVRWMLREILPQNLREQFED